MRFDQWSRMGMGLDTSWSNTVSKNEFSVTHGRRSVRRGTRAACQVVTETDFRLLGELALDVSTTGLFLRTATPAAVGETVFVALRLPGGVSWIDATGRVARIVRGGRRGDLARGIGIEFDRLATLDKALLMGSLHGKPPRAPSRALPKDYASAVVGYAA